MSKNKKSVAILFSGGIDSTYLLQKNLEEGNSVKLFQNCIINNHNKFYSEQKASKKIVTYYENKFNVSINLSLNVKVEINNSRSTIPQLLIWIFAAAMTIEHVDEIQIGYIMNDDAISFLPDIKKLYKAYEAFNGKLPKLVFPLIKLNKYDILKNIDHDALKLTTTCEDPIIEGELKSVDILNRYGYYYENIVNFKYSDCGNCYTCKKRKTYLEEADLNHLFMAEKVENLGNFSEVKNNINTDIVNTYLEA